MASDPEEGFTVRDRRRYLADDVAPATPAAESTETPQAAEPTAAEMQETYDAFREAFGDSDGLPPEMSGPEGPAELPDVYSVLALFLQELRGLAWLRMGLVANPSTGKIERDLGQARVAIDTVAFLASQLEQVVPPEERLPLKALVSDLQVNFVEQSKRGSA
jgi:Domain of unknown function (DUF1844).